MRKRLTVPLILAVIFALAGSGCSSKQEEKRSVDMPKGGLKGVAPKGTTSPVPLSPSK